MSFLKKILLIVAVSLPSASVVAGDVLSYWGEGGAPLNYSLFEAATGKSVFYSAVLPADLSIYDCILLPINGLNSEAFSESTLAALDGYVRSGGRVIAQAEHGTYPGPIDAMNGLAAYLGAQLAVLPDTIDCGYNVTTNIHPSNFTVGVNSIGMACTSQVGIAIGPNAHSLAGTPTDNIPFIGVDVIGDGLFFLFGDGNVFEASVFGIGEDNGILAANVCDQAIFADVYSCIDSFDPPFDRPLALKPKKNGAIPVKMTLYDEAGNIVEEGDLASMPVVNIEYQPAAGEEPNDANNDLLPLGQANDGNVFRYDSFERKFVYNLATKPHKSAGTYTVSAVSSDASYLIEGCSQEFDRQ